MIKQNLDFSFYLSVFCCLHLWLLCLFLVFKKIRGGADYILAAFLFCFSSIHLQHLLLQVGYLRYVPFLDPVMGLILSCAGPLFYFYVRSMTGEDSLLNKMKVHLLVLLPAAINLVFLLITKSGPELRNHYYEVHNQATQYTLINLLLLLGMLGYFFFYLIASIRILNRHHISIRQSYSNIEKMQLDWLRDLIIVLMIFACIIAPVTIFIADTRISQLSVGYFSTFIYFIIVYKSLNYSVVFSSPAIHFPERNKAIEMQIVLNQEEHQNDVLIPDQIPFVSEEQPLIPERYSKSALTNQQVEEYGQSVEIFLVSNNLLYDQDLSLKQMSATLNLSPHVLSEVINRYYNKNFFELINSYRIEEAKKQLKQIEKLNYTVEGVGYSCGFGSRTAFYRAFKKYTNMTPTEFNSVQTSQRD